MESYLKLVGNNIRSARKERGISQEALADMAGIDRSHMGYIERGKKNIRVCTLIKVAEALELNPGSLFDTQSN